ncbi:hypothetical protein [Pseudohaliea sp.]|uniref:hypothetical protein n=1 Tax=Pseudohaliea sp. TaxID=2740289 RepID=UPI0032EFDF5A
MTAQDALTLLHLLLFCYWLGGDIGVFYSAGFVVDAERSREARLTAAKIMLGIDLVPRICMSLMLTVGGLLSEYAGISHPPWQLAGIILLGPLWLGMVLVLHFAHGAAFIPLLTRVDFLFRWLVIAGIIASTAWSTASGRLADAPWLAGKLLAFAFLVFCGLMIRVQFKGFATAYGKLAAGTQTAADDAAMAASLARVRPWVVMIWAVLLLEAFLGVVQPG